MTEKKRALILDLDGVVVGKPTPFLKTLARYAIHGSKLFEPPAEIKGVPERFNSVLNPLEWLLLKATARRKVTEEARSYLETQSKTGEIDIYVNTGRPNKKPWVNATIRTLDKGRVLPYLEDVVFKSSRIQAEIAKAVNAKSISQGYEHIVIVDDNPLDALMIAKFLPEAEVIILQSLTGGILFSRVEHQNYPNVRRVASLNTIVESNNS